MNKGETYSLLTEQRNNSLEGTFYALYIKGMASSYFGIYSLIHLVQFMDKYVTIYMCMCVCISMYTHTHCSGFGCIQKYLKCRVFPSGNLPCGP